MVDWVSGACLSSDETTREAVGLLDERYFIYCEDVDFCAALRDRGRRIWFLPSTEIVHYRGRSVAWAPAATQACLSTQPDGVLRQALTPLVALAQGSLSASAESSRR